MSTWEWIEILVSVWVAMSFLSLIVIIPLLRVISTRVELNTVDFDDWVRRAQWAEPIGRAQCSCKEDQHDH